MPGSDIVIITGQIWKEIDLSFTPSGMAIAKFTISTSKKIKEQWKNKYHKIVSFNKTAETISKHFKPMDWISITGELNYGSYQHKDGHTVYTTDIVVNQFPSFVGNKSKSGQVSQSQEKVDNEHDNFNNPPPDDDIPF